MTIEQRDSDPTKPPAMEARPYVLIVDDSRLMRAALSRLLSSGYQVIEAEDGEQGWQALLANPEIELVFSDLSMPVVDGFELLRRVRAADPPAICNLPFVVITGHEDDEGMRRKAVRMGASDFVSKPFRSTEITTRAKTLTEQQRSMRELQKELDERATVDAATGLANAVQFMARFEQLLSLAQRHGLASACLLVQIDGFAQWAANVPAEETGPLLRQVADLLGELSRTEDVTGYLGDGRYGLVLCGSDRDGALALARRLGSQLGAVARSGQHVPAVSIGVSAPGEAWPVSADELLQTAQAGLQALPEEASAVAGQTGGRPQADILLLQQELEQARDSQLLAEQAERSQAEQLRTLQSGARQQLAKAHQIIATLRTQLKTTQAKFHEYAQRYSQAAQLQAETELEQLRVTLAERDTQLKDEQARRIAAQETIAQLQASLAAAQQEAPEPVMESSSLLSRLLRRG